MAERARYLRTAVSWCYIGLQQTERVSQSVDEWLAFLSTPGMTISHALPESRRLTSLYHGDVHFLITAAYHVTQALDRMPSPPRLPKPLKNQIGPLRHLFEHWWHAPERRGQWKGLAEQHGIYATPWELVGEGSDIMIGPDGLSLKELKQGLTDVLNELLRMESGS